MGGGVASEGGAGGEGYKRWQRWERWGDGNRRAARVGRWALDSHDLAVRRKGPSRILQRFVLNKKQLADFRDVLNKRQLTSPNLRTWRADLERRRGITSQFCLGYAFIVRYVSRRRAQQASIQVHAGFVSQEKQKACLLDRLPTWLLLLSPVPTHPSSSLPYSQPGTRKHMLV